MSCNFTEVQLLIITLFHSDLNRSSARGRTWTVCIIYRLYIVTAMYILMIRSLFIPHAEHQIISNGLGAHYVVTLHSLIYSHINLAICHCQKSRNLLQPPARGIRGLPKRGRQVAASRDFSKRKRHIGINVSGPLNLPITKLRAAMAICSRCLIARFVAGFVALLSCFKSLAIALSCLFTISSPSCGLIRVNPSGSTAISGLLST